MGPGACGREYSERLKAGVSWPGSGASQKSEVILHMALSRKRKALGKTGNVYLSVLLSRTWAVGHP